MPQHGDTQKGTEKMFCGYWMTIDEWEDIHNYRVGEKSGHTDVNNTSMEQKE